MVVIGGGLSGLIAHRTLNALGIEHTVVTPRSGWGSMWISPGLLSGLATIRETIEIGDITSHVLLRGHVVSIKVGSLTTNLRKEIHYDRLIYTGSKPRTHVRVVSGSDKVLVLKSIESLAGLKKMLMDATSVTLVACCDYVGLITLIHEILSKLGATLFVIKHPRCNLSTPLGNQFSSDSISVYGKPGGIIVKLKGGKAIASDIVMYLPHPEPDYTPLASLGGKPVMLSWWFTDPRVDSVAPGGSQLLYAGSPAIGLTFRGKRIMGGIGRAVLTGLLSSLVVYGQNPPLWCVELLHSNIGDHELLGVFRVLLKDFDKSIYKALEPIIKAALKTSQRDKVINNN